MTGTLILIGIILAALGIGGVALKSWISNRTIGRARDTIAVSKENDKKRNKVIEILTEHQEDIKETVKKTNGVVKTHRDKLLNRKEKLDARRKKND